MKKLMKLWVTAVVVMFAASALHAAMDDKSIRDRTMPVGKVCVEGEECGSASPAGDSGPKSPEDIYQASCFGCHGTGALSAPKFGDANAWAPRVANGLEALVVNAISGVNSMPPKGTCSSCSDDDIRGVVEYILNNSK